MKPLAMVVGASQRVGRAVALQLARSGFDLIITFGSDHVGAQETQTMASAHGAKVTLLKLDLNDAAGALAAARALELKKLDALIVSAAYWEKDILDDHDNTQAARFMRINCSTPIELARELAPALRCSSLPGGASVMAFGDIHVDFRPMKEFSRYLESKSSLQKCFRLLALELAPEIRVNVIVAGVIAWPASMSDTERSAYIKRVPLGRVGAPSDAAALVRFVTLEAPFMTGSAITLDGGRSLGLDVD
ncbi:MAG: SDR family oxidoreductase [Phycisphaerales bacterium]|nr:SDR family oxidoreductase [Phycisphaerales bacterium]